MAKQGVIPSKDAWRQIVSEIELIQREIRNIKLGRPSPKLFGAGVNLIEFELLETLKRGETKTATHLPWSDEGVIDGLEVIEKNKMSSELLAPIGCTGFAVRRSIGWVILVLDCDALQPIDGGVQENAG